MKYQVWYLDDGDDTLGSIWSIYDETDCPLEAIAMLNGFADIDQLAVICRSSCVEVDSNG